MYLGIYLLLFAVACETKEPPECKKMDQSGTICLDGAQASAPANAAGTGGGGMTQAQMLELMKVFQQNHQQGLNNIPNTMPVAQAILNTKEQLEAEKLRLQKENVRLNHENSTTTSRTTMENNKIIIDKNKLEIKFIDERLASIAEATKDPNIFQQIGGIAVGECFKSFEICMGKLGQGVSWLWERTPWGGESEADAVERIQGE